MPMRTGMASPATPWASLFSRTACCICTAPVTEAPMEVDTVIRASPKLMTVEPSLEAMSSRRVDSCLRRSSSAAPEGNRLASALDPTSSMNVTTTILSDAICPCAGPP